MDLDALPPLLTRRPEQLLLEQWATPPSRPPRVALRPPYPITAAAWHAPRVLVLDVTELDLVDLLGHRAGYTIAVGIGPADAPALLGAVERGLVDLGAQIDWLPQRRGLTVVLDRARAWSPSKLRAQLAAIATPSASGLASEARQEPGEGA